MAEGFELEDSIKSVLDSPGAQIIKDASSFFRRQAKYLVLLFIFCVVAGFNLTKTVVTWLIADERLPTDVNIIVTSPIEFILLQFQIAVSFAMLVLVIYLLLALARSGSTNAAIRERFAELELKPPKVSISLIFTITAVIALGLCGLLYAWNFLTPMILQYLTDDAQSAGLTTEWKLSGYVGFIVNLVLACMVGFQAPVVTVLCLRFGLTSPSQIRLYRKHIWFAAFVLGAFLSPPDPVSLFLVAMPVVILFETALMLDKFINFSNT